jgi:hypothetical protein
MFELNEVIDLNRYPIDRLSSAEAKGWLREVRDRLADDGSCVFPQFVHDKALQTLASEASAIAHLAYPGPTEVSPYFFNYKLGQGQQYADDHPLYRMGKRNLGQIATDLIPESHLLDQLYRHPSMRDFLAEIVSQPVYLNADPYQSLNISVMNEGGCQQWHFDGSKMVTTLLLQEPEAGGVFEYVPGIRSEDSENFDAVQSVLDGDSDAIRQIKLQAGSLSLFQGHYSIHRVTDVIGNHQRLQAILGYSTEPGYLGKFDSSLLHYGPRIAEIEAITPVYSN